MRQLVRILFWQSLVVKGTRCGRIEGQIELVFPAELETRPGQGIVADLRARMSFCQVGRVRGEPIGNDTVP
jgi:hypothetical protein